MEVNFTFQVEKTYTAIYNPNPQLTQNLPNAVQGVDTTSSSRNRRGSIMANYNDDLSDIRPDSGISANVSPTQLPIRGEKRIIPAPVSPSDMNDEFDQAYFKSGQKPPNVVGYADSSARQQLIESDDFNVHAALSPYVDYVTIRLYNRGLGGNGNADGNPAVYRFLINPSQVQINRTTLDGQAFARAGWQIGVWGEDSIQVNLTGKTAGQYFAFGLTDKYQPYTESYRNLEQLQVVFENNGYWFEGEQAAEGSVGCGLLASHHQDARRCRTQRWQFQVVWYVRFADVVTICRRTILDDVPD